MSLLKSLTAGKSAIGAVMGDKNDTKAETRPAESNSAPASKVDTAASASQRMQAAKAPSILGVLGSRSGGTVSDSDSSKPSNGDSGAIQPVAGATAAVAAKPSLLAAVAARERSEQAKHDFEHLFTKIPENFQDRLDLFDTLMKQDQGEIDFNLDRARDFVKRIMIDLRENPEYDGMIIDRDIHNIIAYQRRLKALAREVIGEKTVKAAKKAAKPKAASRFSIDIDSIDLTAQPKTLKDLSGLDADFGDME